MGGTDQIITFDPNVAPGEEPVPVYAEYERYTASSGNPYLKPMESYNYDLSLDWYFPEKVFRITTAVFRLTPAVF